MNAAMIYARLGRAEELERWRSRLLARAPDASAELYFDLVGEFVPAATAERALVVEPGEGGAADVRDARAAREEAGRRRMPGARPSGRGRAPKT